jgi:hypothetical protein
LVRDEGKSVVTTYFLTGNPNMSNAIGGMNVPLYEGLCQEIARNGYADGRWTFWSSDSQPGDQVVLLRTGRNGGINGFGLRREGEPETGHNGRRDYPVRFHNLRSILNPPYITRDIYKNRYGFWPSNNLRQGGHPLDDRLLSALDTCCRAELGAAFSELCSRRI